MSSTVPGKAWLRLPRCPQRQENQLRPKDTGHTAPTPHDVCVAQQVLSSSKCDVLRLFCYINLPLQIKDLKQDFLFRFPKKTNTAVFTLLWSSNNPIFSCLKKKNAHTLNSSYKGFYSHWFRKNHLPAACSCQIILVNIQKNNHPSSPDWRTFSNQKKNVPDVIPRVSWCIHSTLLTFYYLEVLMT